MFFAFIKCNGRCKTKACQDCKIARKVAKQNCRECYNERNADCTHAHSERAITGLWTTAEMEKAQEKGYKIVKIYDVWHFQQSSTELWKEYIRKFLKIKLETSSLHVVKKSTDERHESLVLSLES